MERPLHSTTGLCGVCKDAIAADVVAREDASVWMKKRCAEHGQQEVRLSDDAAWYERSRAIRPKEKRPRVVAKEVAQGCPFDCGPCTEHEQAVRLPVVTITSACNLDCPICYVHNKNDGAFHMGPEEFRKILGHLVSDHGGELDIVNFTGGEPTMHPHFLEFLKMAREAGVHRVTICSNGIKLAKDESLVKAIGENGGRIALSFDTFDEAADTLLQGRPMLASKLETLERCERHGVDVTLIPVMTRGVNDGEIGRILELAWKYDCIRHVEVHTITYTGQGGKGFDPDRSGRISLREVLARIEQTTAGLLVPADFVPSPHAHSLCYQIAYLLMDPDGGPPVPFTRFLSRETLYDLMSDRLYLEPNAKLEGAFREAIDRLWSEDGDPRLLALLRRVLEEMFPSGRTLTREESLRIAERVAKAVYVHSHMDEETFDVERVMQCCDSNCYADGTTIPVCAYNVLYRETEEHFMLQPKGWNDRRRGLVRGRLPVIHG